MATEWTSDQLKVIKHKDGNLLVAAAAGSGKTAVLSERILELLKDEKADFDVDRLLVVTFTRAAAAEMKDRIGKKIFEHVAANPADAHMRKQAALINNASITTIDSFCNSIVREFFHVCDIDPAFRIADGNSSEMKSIMDSILKELIEEKYAEEDADFLEFSNAYGTSGKKDNNLEGYIYALFNASQSNPYPEYWLKNCLKDNLFTTPEAFDESQIGRDITDKVRMMIPDLLRPLDKAIDIANEPDGPDGYLVALESDQKLYNSLKNARTYTEMLNVFTNASFEKIGSKAGGKEQKEAAKALRDSSKKAFQDIKAKLFADPIEKVIENGIKTSKALKTLTELTLEFMKRFNEVKKENGLYSFSDIEHMALNILLSGDPENPELTTAAQSLRERYEYIVVDEYQDSNLLQESILNAISRRSLITPEHPEGQPNVFMVGDVKQSIYRFREANPGLFREKYDTYGEDGLYSKIVLKKNFRSRQQVLDGANVIFEWCMHNYFGGIEYDDAAALYVGNTGYTDVENEKYNPELIIIKTDKQDHAENDTVYQEAYSTVEYIKKLMAPDSDFKVTRDKTLEKPRYSDIAILMKSLKGYAEKFTEVLLNEGIPVSVNVSKGFFETGEVKTIVNFLRCLCNPRQDIPFAAVLLSPMVQATNEELADIVSKSGFLFDDILKKRENGETLSESIRDFMDKYFFLKRRAGILPVSQLIDEIYEYTGFYTKMFGFPQGSRRAANLDFFREQAVEFEETGKAGLHSFVEYLNDLEDRDIDFGEAGAENIGDAVSIMSIHHSKGLEYPVVIVPQIFKGRNNRDQNSPFVIHPDLGPAINYIDPERKTKRSTLSHNYFSDVLLHEAIAEELRVLYVAVTRAREKLVLIGAAPDLKKAFPEPSGNDTLSFRELASSKNYYDYVKGAIFRENGVAERFRSFAEDLDSLYAEPSEGDFHSFDPYTEHVTFKSATTGNLVTWDVSVVPGHGKLINAVIRNDKAKAAREYAESVLSGEEGRNSGFRDEIEELKAAAEYEYPYAGFTTKAVKRSVSELKHEAMKEAAGFEDDYDRGVEEVWAGKAAEKHRKYKLQRDPEDSENKGVSGSRIGTATHRIMELLPFEKPMDIDAVKAFTASCAQKGLIEQEDSKLAECECIAVFTQSPVYARMCAANAKGTLFREQAFTIGIQAEGGDEDDINLIQGVIDAYFTEDDGAVLIDYKTDRADPEEIGNRYRRQLELYAEAITRVRKIKVKEKLIFSFYNNALLSL